MKFPGLEKIQEDLTNNITKAEERADRLEENANETLKTLKNIEQLLEKLVKETVAEPPYTTQGMQP